MTAIWLGAGAYVYMHRVGQDVRYGIRDMRCEMVDVDVGIGMACRAVAAPHDERRETLTKWVLGLALFFWFFVLLSRALAVPPESSFEIPC